MRPPRGRGGGGFRGRGDGGRGRGRGGGGRGGDRGGSAMKSRGGGCCLSKERRRYFVSFNLLWFLNKIDKILLLTFRG
ncbi:uncharacterized protein LOC128286974 [Gossypium arboreum]|uniref:Uncharacterized protein n=2 Tax=Gossypium TaxID=3633 RepID=A0A5D2NYW3_GOSTO|nr:uncharacterized protein LOC128286974 [Gossypium arboreum]TYH00917.1 hypothetical protein ES288_A09G015200v1 [Gossypium darwinii]TYH90628.1 hypothetical protein ES332_A13G062000v1 [Gossypium tomentosum]TYI08643.1 hypothetical protein ES332_A09G014100v1 [Gossypium tomentosum]